MLMSDIEMEMMRETRKKEKELSCSLIYLYLRNQMRPKNRAIRRIVRIKVRVLDTNFCRLFKP